MTSAYEHQYKHGEPPPGTLVESPTENQQQLLSEFDVVGPDDSVANSSRGRLFARRKSANAVEVAQVVDGSVSIVSLRAADLVEILEAADWGGGVLSSVIDGWWQVRERCRPVTDSVDTTEGEERAQEIVATADGVNQSRIHAHHPTPRVEVSQEAGQDDEDVHTIVATKLDLARVLVVSQLQPAIRRLTRETPDTDPSPTVGEEVFSVISEYGVVNLFGYRRLKAVAMDVSPPGRIRALKVVSVLAVIGFALALLRIQVTGISGIGPQLAIVGQHLGVASSTIVVGLAIVSVLKAKSEHLSSR